MEAPGLPRCQNWKSNRNERMKRLLALVSSPKPYGRIGLVSRALRFMTGTCIPPTGLSKCPRAIEGRTRNISDKIHSILSGRGGELVCSVQATALHIRAAPSLQPPSSETPSQLADAAVVQPQWRCRSRMTVCMLLSKWNYIRPPLRIFTEKKPLSALWYCPRSRAMPNLVFWDGATPRRQRPAAVSRATQPASAA